MKNNERIILEVLVDNLPREAEALQRILFRNPKENYEAIMALGTLRGSINYAENRLKELQKNDQ